MTKDSINLPCATLSGKSSESVQLAMLKACDAGMTNYPIGPHRDPIGPHWTPSDQSALNIVLPPANHRTVIYSLTRVHLANTFDNRCTRKITNLNTIETNPL